MSAGIAEFTANGPAGSEEGTREAGNFRVAEHSGVGTGHSAAITRAIGRGLLLHDR